MCVCTYIYTYIHIYIYIYAYIYIYKCIGVKIARAMMIAFLVEVTLH